MKKTIKIPILTFIWTCILLIPGLIIYTLIVSVYYHHQTYDSYCIPFESSLSNKKNPIIGDCNRLVEYKIDLGNFNPIELKGFPKRAHRVKVNEKVHFTNVIEWIKFNKLPEIMQQEIIKEIEQNKELFPKYYDDLAQLDFENTVYFSGTFKTKEQYEIPICFESYLKIGNTNTIRHFDIKYFIDIKKMKLFVSFWEAHMFP